LAEREGERRILEREAAGEGNRDPFLIDQQAMQPKNSLHQNEMDPV
jgi:hypothetical protein